MVEFFMFSSGVGLGRSRQRLLDLGAQAIRISFFLDSTSVRESDFHYVEEVDL